NTIFSQPKPFFLHPPTSPTPHYKLYIIHYKSPSPTLPSTSPPPVPSKPPLGKSGGGLVIFIPLPQFLGAADGRSHPFLLTLRLKP
ncbi:MAG: hypothetical protein KBS75_09395, partial [Bacteroidales bacterium]|nr:hypothetical protein [Candidatus Equimonas faecalis]